MRMLHPDGRLVYSTCSLNPVENEAVVAEALRVNPGKSDLTSSNSFRLLTVTYIYFYPQASSWSMSLNRCPPLSADLVSSLGPQRLTNSSSSSRHMRHMLRVLMGTKASKESGEVTGPLQKAWRNYTLSVGKCITITLSLPSTDHDRRSYRIIVCVYILICRTQAGSSSPCFRRKSWMRHQLPARRLEKRRSAQSQWLLLIATS